MRFKKGVKIFGVRNEISLAIICVNQMFHDFTYSCVITSVTDGKHSRTSLHNSGGAFDVRTRYLEDDEAKEIALEIADALTDEFDVVLEKDHLHIEFQPKS